MLTSGGNHAKIAVSTDAARPFVVFGDESQQGTLSGDCQSAQNGCGGLAFMLRNATLAASMTQLLNGRSAPSASTGPRR